MADAINVWGGWPLTDQEQYDLERVRLYWELKKDSNLGWLFAVLFPSIIAIFIVAENYIQANPPNLVMGNAVSVIGFLALVAYGSVWYVRMRNIVRMTVKLLDRVKSGREIDSMLPDSYKVPSKSRKAFLVQF